MKYFNNWKTSAAGIAVILGAVADLLHHFSAGTPIDWNVTIAGFISGIGLLVAKDGSTHSTAAEVEVSTEKAQAPRP